LFEKGYNAATAHRYYEFQLELTTNEDDLQLILADRAINPDRRAAQYPFTLYRNANLGQKNGINMWKKLEELVNEYNQNKYGIAKLIPYDSSINQAFILIVVTKLMLKVHQYVQQAGEICYIDASSSFESNNIPFTFIYTSNVAGALPLGIIATSDQTERTLSLAFKFYQEILLKHLFLDMVH
jgi:hypothetical protein